MNRNLNINNLMLWQESSLFVGGIANTEPHSHNALQCCIALDGTMQVKLLKQWVECSAAIIDSNQTHSIACQSGIVCLLYLEKNSPQYISINKHCLINKDNFGPKQPFLINEKIPQSLTDAANFFRAKIPSNNSADCHIIKKANILRNACLKYFGCDFKQNSVIDNRVLEIVDYIKFNLNIKFTGKLIAEHIGLSESRMQHLFKQNIGIPVRRYILWARLRVVILHCVNGISLTAAAHAAGFSDLAHFARTFKSMFGMKATTLINSDSQFSIVFCDEVSNFVSTTSDIESS